MKLDKTFYRNSLFTTPLRYRLGASEASSGPHWAQGSALTPHGWCVGVLRWRYLGDL